MAKKKSNTADQLLGCAAIAAQMYFDAHPEEADKYPELAAHARKMNESNNSGPIIDQLKKVSDGILSKTGK